MSISMRARDECAHPDSPDTRPDGHWSWTAPEGSGAQTVMPKHALRRFSYTFMAPELAAARKEYLTVVIRVVVLTVVLMWACLPIYWGSLAPSATLSHNLVGWVVDRDLGRVGAAVRQTFLPDAGPGSVGWVELAAAVAGDDASIASAIVNEEAWIAVIIEANASMRLTAARQTGDTKYDPTSAITVYYAQARNEIAAANFIVPTVTRLLINSTQTYATSSVQRYLAAVINQNGAVNTTALQLLADAPQTLAPAISWRIVNLKPYTAPVAQAVTLVGQIYICIFAFITTMAHASARAFLEPYLTLSSYLTLRLLFPLAAYVPLSLSYAMVNLPFHLPFGAKFSFAGGFFALAGYTYLGMCAFGLALEAAITVLTPRFVPFFLVLLIIVNISTAALPPELQVGVFAYGAGFPVWNLQQAARTLIFDTASHLGLNAAVLLAWTLLSCATLCLLTWLARRRAVLRWPWRRGARCWPWRRAARTTAGKAACAQADVSVDVFAERDKRGGDSQLESGK